MVDMVVVSIPVQEGRGDFISNKAGLHLISPRPGLKHHGEVLSKSAV